MSSLINKVKDAVRSDKDKSDNPQSANIGPHSSAAMNKADPRIDSDADNRNDPTSRVGGYGTQDTYGSSTGAGVGGGAPMPHQQHGHYQHHPQGSAVPTGTTGGAGYDNPQSANTGPHSSNMMNKMDPRVDSDRDNRNDPTSRVGGYGTQDTYGPGAGTGMSGGAPTHGHHQQHHQQHYQGATGAGAGTGYDNPQSANTGPHSSNMMNKMDPRVDSNRDNRNDPASRVGGYGTQDTYGPGAGTGAGFGGGAPTHHQSTHPSGAGVTGGPGYGNEYGSSATPGTGQAQGTAGPHNSNLLNKLDPRVDSDMDGSKTYGGNATHQ